MGSENGLNDLFKNNLDKKNPTNDTPETKTEEENNMESFNSTEGLLEIAEKDPKKAEKMMNGAFENGPDKYRENKSWLESMQRKIQNVYYERKDYDGVERIILATKDPQSMIGRIKKYEAQVGPWPHERPEISYDEMPTNEPVIDSSSFKKALSQKRYDACENWLKILELNGYKNLPHDQVNNIINDRTRELQKARETTEK